MLRIDSLPDIRDSKGCVPPGTLVASIFRDSFGESTYISEAGTTRVEEGLGFPSNYPTADRVVQILSKEDWDKLAAEMADAMFKPVIKKFPEATSGDYGPEETLILDHSVRSAAIAWLQLNLPIE